MQRLKDLAVSDTGFVFDPFSGSTFTANASALCILDGLKRAHDRDTIAASLRERFEIGDEDLSRDIDDVIASLRLYGILPQDFEVA
ncbi:MAG: PqqD family protein [Polyangiales bacterium]